MTPLWLQELSTVDVDEYIIIHTKFHTNHSTNMCILSYQTQHITIVECTIMKSLRYIAPVVWYQKINELDLTLNHTNIKTWLPDFTGNGCYVLLSRLDERGIWAYLHILSEDRRALGKNMIRPPAWAYIHIMIMCQSCQLPHNVMWQEAKGTPWKSEAIHKLPHCLQYILFAISKSPDAHSCYNTWSSCQVQNDWMLTAWERASFT